jgi:hypothetical protein
VVTEEDIRRVALSLPESVVIRAIW